MLTRNGRPATRLCIAAVLLVALAACGSGTTDGTAAGTAADTRTSNSGPAPAGTSPDDASSPDLAAVSEAAEGILVGAVAATADGAGARVVIDGETYDFRVVDADTGTLAYSYCTGIGGTLQGMMQLVDEQGQGIEGGELEFFLPGSGSMAEQEGDVPEFYFTVPEDESSPVWSHYTLAEIDAPADGNSVSGGTFTLQEFRGSATVSGTFDISC